MIGIESGEFVDSALVRNIETYMFAEESSIIDLRDQGATLMDGSQTTWSSLVGSLTNAAKLRVPLENSQSYGGEDQDFADQISQEIVRLKILGRGDSNVLINALNGCLNSVQNPMVALDSLGIVKILQGSDVPITLS